MFKRYCKIIATILVATFTLTFLVGPSVSFARGHRHYGSYYGGHYGRHHRHHVSSSKEVWVGLGILGAVAGVASIVSHQKQKKAAREYYDYPTQNSSVSYPSSASSTIYSQLENIEPGTYLFQIDSEDERVLIRTIISNSNEFEFIEETSEGIRFQKL